MLIFLLNWVAEKAGNNRRKPSDKRNPHFPKYVRGNCINCYFGRNHGHGEKYSEKVCMGYCQTASERGGLWE